MSERRISGRGELGIAGVSVGWVDYQIIVHDDGLRASITGILKGDPSLIAKTVTKHEVVIVPPTPKTALRIKVKYYEVGSQIVTFDAQPVELTIDPAHIT